MYYDDGNAYTAAVRVYGAVGAESKRQELAYELLRLLMDEEISYFQIHDDAIYNVFGFSASYNLYPVNKERALELLDGFESKNAMILATLRDIAQTALLDRKTAKHQIHLAEKRHIYDMLHHRYLGYGKSFTYEYGPVTQAVFALLPYKGKGIDVKFVPGGAEIKLLADTKKFADHTFHVELLDDKGRIVPAFNDVVLGKGNKAFYKFRKPLNAKGKWKLQVREVLTSLSRTVELP